MKSFFCFYNPQRERESKKALSIFYPRNILDLEIFLVVCPLHHPRKNPGKIIDKDDVTDRDDVTDPDDVTDRDDVTDTHAHEKI